MDLQWLRDNYSHLVNYAIDLCEVNIINRMYELPPPWRIIRKKIEQFEDFQKKLIRDIEKHKKNGKTYDHITLAKKEDYYIIIKNICDNQVDPSHNKK